MKKEDLKKRLNDLILEGQRIFSVFCWDKYPDAAEQQDIPKAKGSLLIQEDYHTWFTSTSSLLKGFAPDRYKDFIDHYYADSKRKHLTYAFYKIEDWLLSISPTGSWNHNDCFFHRFQQQLIILKSALTSFDDIASSIGDIIQADLFDTELEAAQDLLKKKHTRAAGVVAGVVLEGHLKSICGKHNIKFQKKKPTMVDFYEGLKKEDIIDFPTWRKIQYLADIRNYCGHKKEREATSDEVDELINGTKKIISTVF